MNISNCAISLDLLAQCISMSRPADDDIDEVKDQWDNTLMMILEQVEGLFGLEVAREFLTMVDNNAQG